MQLLTNPIYFTSAPDWITRNRLNDIKHKKKVKKDRIKGNHWFCNNTAASQTSSADIRIINPYFS